MANPHDNRSATVAAGQPDADTSWLARVDQFLAARSHRRLAAIAGLTAAAGASNWLATRS